MVVDTLRTGTTGKDRWQAKSLRSTFGNQCMSQLPTSPSCGFGSAIREATDKVCIIGQIKSLPVCKLMGHMLALPEKASLESLETHDGELSKCVCVCADICISRCGQSKLQI